MTMMIDRQNFRESLPARCRSRRYQLTAFALAFALHFLTPAMTRADMAQVIDAKVEVQVNGLYAFSVTLQHPDEGWSHYADEWRVIGENGNVLGVRTLFHPHENNVPFTRSLANVKVPIGTQRVTIQAHCSVDGSNPVGLVLELPPR